MILHFQPSAFREVPLQHAEGRLAWKSQFPLVESVLAAPVTVRACDTPDGLTGYTSFQHGRSACLGLLPQGGAVDLYVFAKGLGWTNGLTAGWTAELGNLGVFPLAGAKHEQVVATALQAAGLPVITPLEIWEYTVLPGPYGGPTIPAESVIGLDGKPARPALFVYGCSSPYRVCDLWPMTDDERESVLSQAFKSLGATNASDYLVAMASQIGKTCGFLHSMGGHNYTASAHNLFLDGTLVDFEYCFLPEHPTPEAALNVQPAAWQDKEFLGWYDTLRALAGTASPEVLWAELAGCLLESYLAFDGNPNLDIIRYVSRALQR